VAKLDFAYWDAMGEREMSAGRPAEIYERHIELARRAEQLGFHSYFTIEHQNSPVGQITAPTVYLCAVARATTTLRLGAMIWQLPLHNPVQLAEEVAMLDQLSHGRVEFGTGIGVHEHEFLRWGMDYAERGPMGSEALEIIKLAWTQDEVTFKGNYWRYDEAFPAPKPYQQPYPPIWVAAHSAAALEFAAKNNYNIAQNIDTDAVAAEKFVYFRKVWKECGHSGPVPRIFIQRNVHVAETDAMAREEAEPYMLSPEANPLGSEKIAQSRIGWGSHPRGMGAESERSDNVERGRVFRESMQSYDFNVENGLTLVGSPETVIRKLQESRQRVGYDLFCGNHAIGAMPHDLVEKSVQFFGQEVIPAFR
jgi:alkanesulfonate monooxygenase SsuD/methylene tetrahydromethanopterin reductase-like flavin-dependent oxidoreductase (luciferase family)